MSDISRQNAESIMEEVLSREDFSEKPKADLSWLEKILEDIFEFLGKTISKVFEFLIESIGKTLKAMGFSGVSSVSVGGANLVEIIAIAIVLLVSLAIIVTVTIFVVRAVKNSKVHKLESGSFEEELEAYSNDSDTPYRKALQLKESGDYRSSFRYLFISLLAFVSTEGIIEIHRSKTNRRYFREIKKNCPDIYEKSVEFMDWFNLSWYGRRETSLEHLDEWFKKYDVIKNCVKALPDRNKKEGRS